MPRAVAKLPALSRSATVAALLALAACGARRDPAPRPPETTSADFPSASGGCAAPWNDEGGPISPGVPSSGNILMDRDGGVIQR